MKGCFGVFALLTTVFSALMFFVFMAQVLMGMDNMILNIGMALFFAVIGAGSGWFSMHFVRELLANRHQSTEQDEHRILSLASHMGGKLTAEEVSIHCHISIDQSKRALENMVRKNTADTWISEGGSMVYVFRGLLESDSKETAEDPFASL